MCDMAKHIKIFLETKFSGVSELDDFLEFVIRNPKNPREVSFKRKNGKPFLFWTTFKY